jgi:hypothetical protein
MLRSGNKLPTCGSNKEEKNTIEYYVLAVRRSDTVNDTKFVVRWILRVTITIRDTNKNAIGMTVFQNLMAGADIFYWL